MKRYKNFIIETAGLSLEDQWNLAKSLSEIENLLNRGVDINTLDNNQETALMRAAYIGKSGVVKFLLTQPGIDINHKDHNDCNALINANMHNNLDVIKLLLLDPRIDIDDDFIERMKRHNRKVENTFLVDYDFQKIILENGREDILFLFDKYNLVNPKIKEENIELFTANKWGLI